MNRKNNRFYQGVQAEFHRKDCLHQQVVKEVEVE